MGASLKIPSSLDGRAALVFLGLFASVFLLAGLALGYFFFIRPWQESRAAQTWLATPCRIISSEVKRHSSKSTTYSLDILYQYEVTGQNYQSTRYDFTPGASSDYSWRAGVVSQFPAGKQTLCYVDPQHPAEAVLSRNYVNSPAGLVVPGVFSLIGLGLLLPVFRGAIRRMKFGDSVFDLNDAPVPIGGALEGTVNLSRNIQPMEGFTVKLACINRTVTGSGKSQQVREVPLWQNSRQIMADTGSSITVGFALPEDGFATSAVNPRNRTFWRLEVSAKVPGIDYAAQFEVPVARAELSEEEKAEARKLRAVDGPDDAAYQLPAHSRIRVEDTAGGKMFYFPAMRNPGMVIFLTLFTLLWTGVLWVIIHLGAPILFAIVFGFFEFIMLLSWVNVCFGTSRVVTENGTITLTKHLFGVGRSKAIPAADIREIKVGIGATMNSQVYYNVQIVRQNGTSQTAGAEVADAHEAHWLALEMAKGVGLNP